MTLTVHDHLTLSCVWVGLVEISAVKMAVCALQKCKNSQFRVETCKIFVFGLLTVNLQVVFKLEFVAFMQKKVLL